MKHRITGCTQFINILVILIVSDVCDITRCLGGHANMHSVLGTVKMRQNRWSRVLDIPVVVLDRRRLPPQELAIFTVPDQRSRLHQKWAFSIYLLLRNLTSSIVSRYCFGLAST
jgi:hypothetical protein